MLDGPTQTLTIQGNAQLMKAAKFAELIVAVRNGQPVRLKDVADVQDSFQSVKTAGTYNGERSTCTVLASGWRCTSSTMERSPL